MRNLSYHRSFSLQVTNKLGSVVFFCFLFFFFICLKICTPLHKAISVWSHDLREFRLFARAHRLERVFSFKAFSVSISCKLLRLWYFFLKVALELLNGRVLGSLGRQLLMTSTQEPNKMAPQSALCICSRKWQTKLIVPICFGTKTFKFCLRIVSFSSLESELSFDLKDSEINFDRARSATQREITAWRFGSNLQYFKRRRGRPLCGRAVCILGMDTKWKSRKTKNRKEKSKTA